MEQQENIDLSYQLKIQAINIKLQQKEAMRLKHMQRDIFIVVISFVMCFLSIYLMLIVLENAGIL